MYSVRQRFVLCQTEIAAFMPFWDSFQLEVIKTALALIVVAVGWLVGQRIITYWDLKKKRQEFDISTANEFHKLYGEFKEVSRLWRSFHFTGGKTVPFPEGTRLELLKRATASEGGIEAIIVKLSTERKLGADDIRTLGLFRQAFQKLREAIRDDQDFLWTSGTLEYQMFNDLASRTACIISTNKPRGTGRRSKSRNNPAEVLRRITSVTAIDWENELKACKRKPGQSVASPMDNTFEQEPAQ
jgi:hypothetical protein